MYKHVIWPEQYGPRHSLFYALNAIDGEAPRKHPSPAKALPSWPGFTHGTFSKRF
jgi:hypothetical protein